MQTREEIAARILEGPTHEYELRNPEEYVVLCSGGCGISVLSTVPFEEVKNFIKTFHSLFCEDDDVPS